MKQFPRRKRVTNFPRKLSEEHSQKFHVFFPGQIVTCKSFPTNFLDFSEKISVEKVSASSYKISELNIRLRRCAGCVSFFFLRQPAFVRRRGGDPRHALKWSSNNSVRTHILKRAAPGRRSAVPSRSLSRLAPVTCTVAWSSPSWSSWRTGWWTRVKHETSGRKTDGWLMCGDRHDKIEADSRR